MIGRMVLFGASGNLTSQVAGAIDASDRPAAKQRTMSARCK
jgi:hypothetical protein